jgi:hypothetical protein
MKLANTSVSKTFFLTAFLFFANDYQRESEQLMPFLQEHYLTFAQLNKKKPHPFFKQFPIFYKNINCIVRSQHPLSKKDCFLLSQLLQSKVQVLFFFYNEEMLTSSRLKQIQKNLSGSRKHLKTNNIAAYTSWRSFSEQQF